jgi:adenosylmethionine-8-amino-7-oxononanoate aminotransferase
MENLTSRLLKRGIFTEPSSYTSTLLLMPPLVITDEDWARALDVIEEEIADMTRKGEFQ